MLKALLSRGYNATAIVVDRELPFTLREQQIEVAWLALHGEYGEDGCVQGLLEVMAFHTPALACLVVPSQWTS